MANHSENREGSGSVVRIVNVPSSAPLIVRFLGNYHGMNLHWHSGRTEACLGAGACPPSTHRSRLIWRAYAAVEAHNAQTRKWTPAVLEVTESLDEFLRNRALRGEVWYLLREPGKGKTAPVLGRQLDMRPPDVLRPAFDFSPILRRIFRLAALPEHVPNPFPARVILCETDGEAPVLPPELIGEGARELSPEEWKKLASKLAGRTGILPPGEPPPSSKKGPSPVGNGEGPR